MINAWIPRNACFILVLQFLAAASAYCAGDAPSAGNWKNPFAFPSHYKADLKAIAPGRQLISEPSGGPVYWVGKPLVLHVNPASVHHASKVRQVRLFRLGGGLQPTSLADQAAGDCDLFISTVFSIGHDPRYPSRLETQEVFSNAYLVDRVEGGKPTLVDAKWLAVFEMTDDPSSVFRIHKSNTEAYFAGAWTFTLQASKSYTAEEVRDATSGRMDIRSELARRDKTVVCHIVEILQAANGTRQEFGAVAMAAADCGDLSPPTP